MYLLQNIQDFLLKIPPVLQTTFFSSAFVLMILKILFDFYFKTKIGKYKNELENKKEILKAELSKDICKFDAYYTNQHIVYAKLFEKITMTFDYIHDLFTFKTSKYSLAIHLIHKWPADKIKKHVETLKILPRGNKEEIISLIDKHKINKAVDLLKDYVKKYELAYAYKLVKKSEFYLAKKLLYCDETIIQKTKSIILKMKNVIGVIQTKQSIHAIDDDTSKIQLELHELTYMHSALQTEIRKQLSELGKSA